MIAILFNPIAGSGGAHTAAENMKRGLESDGADVVLIATERAAAKLWLRPRLAGVSTLVIAGGDGAVRAAAAEAAAAGVPIWHAPSGTENLIAKSFGMTRDPRAIARAILATQVVTAVTAVTAPPRKRSLSWRPSASMLMWSTR